MSEFGLTSTGLIKPTYADLDESLRKRATAAFRSVLGKDSAWELSWDNSSPVTVFYRVLESELYYLWNLAEAIYYAGNPLTATGDALDLLVSEHGIVRTPAQKAKGIVTLRLSGAAGSAIIPAGSQITATNGTEFVTLEAADLSRGPRDVWVEAVEPGADGNLAAGALTSLAGNLGQAVDVDSSFDEAVLGVTAPANVYWDLPPNSGYGYYQIIQASDVAHPHYIAEVRVWVRNGLGESGVKKYRLEAVLIDDESGQILGRTGEITVELDRYEEREVRWSGLTWDIGYQYDRLRLVIVNGADSEAAIQVMGNTTNPYPNCYWHQGGTVQTGAAALFKLYSQRPGGTWGGTEAETDAELRLRFLQAKAAGAAGHPEAIKAALWQVSGVKAVRVRYNREDSAVDGLPPHSVRVVVEGGNQEDVAYALFRTLPAGVKCDGDLAVEIKDRYGESHTIRYSRPTIKDVYVKVKVKRATGFTEDTVTQIKDAIVRAVGGYTSDGEYHTQGIGRNVSYGKIAQAILSVSGVDDIETLYIGFTSPPDQVVNLDIGDEELAQTSADNIEVSWE